MLKRIRILVFVLALWVARSNAEPIKLHPANPHYYLFKGQPTILITSAEHYGAVINKDFDYVTYFEALKSYGLNYTRIYPGAMFEPMGKFIKENPLGPKPASLIVPWARSSMPGYLYCGNKFDLDRWDPEYFERLKDFVARAAERDIVVEICFFNSQYSDSWPISPLYYENNIQEVGKCDFEDAQTLKHPDLVRREADYVRKITQEVNSFDNVILEICDEPSLFIPHAEAGPWVGHFVEVIKNTEDTLPKRHLVAQEVEGPVGGPIDFSGNPNVSIVVAQYVWEGGSEQLGGMRALDLEYGHNKPIEFNETAWYPVWYKGDKVAASRVEAWEFIVGGGASFNHLNGRYTVRDPAGKTPDNAQILGTLRSLKNFICSFDFLKMHPDKSFIVSGVPAGAYCRSISQPGQQYALYEHHSRLEERNHYYIARPGNYTEKLVLDLPAGTYRQEWLDPASGSVVHMETLTHKGGNRSFTTPPHSVDIALRIKRISERD
ncbi:MAG: hypothetical protein DMG06_06910 [Acidobacteria bacterium]|nr:MAG: hypothetical protein DMG06_06910 [Acidobacteriota bacterium]